MEVILIQHATAKLHQNQTDRNGHPQFCLISTLEWCQHGCHISTTKYHWGSTIEPGTRIINDFNSIIESTISYVVYLCVGLVRTSQPQRRESAHQTKPSVTADVPGNRLQPLGLFLVIGFCSESGIILLWITGGLLRILHYVNMHLTYIHFRPLHKFGPNSTDQILGQ